MISREDLRAAVGEASREELPALVEIFAGAQAEALARLAAPVAAAGPPPPERFISPEEAAAIAGIPVKRLYEWARKKPWAHRPNQRTLRINETGFRRWLESR